MTTQTETAYRGASAEAIQLHYDTSNEFFQLWLGETMAYTCAYWPDGQDGLDLDAAQRAKIDWHLRQAGAIGAARVLDVGCGWASALNHMVAEHGVAHAVGLTLSKSQRDFVAAQRNHKIDIVLQGWADYEPDAPFDAIVSIGAFEAFARLGLSSAEKVRSYCDFFSRCHRWLKPGGRLSLQTIAYNNLSSGQMDPFLAAEIFPEQDLPSLAELAQGFDHLFEIVILRNDRKQYARTLKEWLRRLRSRRADAVGLVGESEVRRFERYLQLCAYVAFESGNCSLLRVGLKRIDKPNGLTD